VNARLLAVSVAVHHATETLILLTYMKTQNKQRIR